MSVAMGRLGLIMGGKVPLRTLSLPFNPKAHLSFMVVGNGLIFFLFQASSRYCLGP